MFPARRTGIQVSSPLEEADATWEDSDYQTFPMGSSIVKKL